jgi:hypothetical protein
VVNDTLGGVPVTIGTPRGMKQQNADKILVFAHAGKRLHLAGFRFFSALCYYWCLPSHQRCLL